MSDNVHKLGAGPLDSRRRDAFIQAVAQSFDLYVEVNGYEPDAIVYVLAGVRQQSRIAWHIEGESQGGPTSILSIAAVHCMTEAGRSRQGLPE